jgi:hypothetical protein
LVTCEKIISNNFFPHLEEIKFSLFVDKKFKGGFAVFGLLDLRRLDVQTFHFQFTMSHNVEKMMQKSTNVNFIIHMWLKIQYFPLLAFKPSEYMKVVEITMVMVLGLG